MCAADAPPSSPFAFPASPRSAPRRSGYRRKRGSAGAFSSVWRRAQAKGIEQNGAGKTPGPQTVDKAHKRKNRPDRIEIRDDFCFLRQLHLHPAVTYVHVSSLGCKCSFLGLQAFSTLCQSVDFVNILSPPPSPDGRGLSSRAQCGAFSFAVQSSLPRHWKSSSLSFKSCRALKISCILASVRVMTSAQLRNSSTMKAGTSSEDL